MYISPGGHFISDGRRHPFYRGQERIFFYTEGDNYYKKVLLFTADLGRIIAVHCIYYSEPFSENKEPNFMQGFWRQF